MLPVLCHYQNLDAIKDVLHGTQGALYFGTAFSVIIKSSKIEGFE
jgi:hypothetical protein